MDRRTVLKGGIILAATSHVVASPPDAPIESISVDEFLKVATPAEIVRYHTNSLMEAMALMHPDKSWAAFTELDMSQILVVGRDQA